MTSNLTDGIDSLSKKKKVESSRKIICREIEGYFNISTPVGGRVGKDKTSTINLPSLSIRNWAYSRGYFMCLSKSNKYAGV